MKRVLLLILIASVCLIHGRPAWSEEQSAEYVIGPGDILEISVWGDESLKKNVIVPPDHIISYPLIGSQDTTGMTVPQLREAVTKKVREFVPDATVTIMLLEIRSLTAYVIGKVNKPGQYPITSETNVMQMLSMAGGLTPFASAGSIVVLRQSGGKTKQFPFDYNEVKKGRNLEQNIVLERGDVVVVP
ncbi:MAG: polysaccharide biosynthesis/export family protein [Thermodesulfobacteriota bacterium]